MDIHTFGERIKELRLEREMTILGLAKAIGFNESAIRKWEKGRRMPSGETIYKFAKFFNVRSDYLIGLED